MNKNLVKILALSALVLSIGACDKKNGGSSSNEPGPGPSTSDTDTSSEPSGPVELTLKEVFELEAGNFVNANKEVTVKDLMVTGQYGSTLMVGYGSTGQGYYLSDVQGFEVEPVEFPQWTGASGVRAQVNVTGTLTDVNGRPVLKNASVEVLAEGADSKYTGCPYISSDYMDREYWNEMGRTQHLALTESTFQIASLPQSPITTDAASEFKVVFPAENTDATDSANEFLIRCLIPAGLTEAAVAWYNAFFFGGTIGTGDDAVTYTALAQDDFVMFDAFTYFDRPSGGMGLLMDSSFCPKYSAVIPEDQRPVIIKTFSQIKEQYDPKYQTALPAIGCEAEGTFSYIINDKFGSNVESVFQDASFVLVDHAEAGPLGITFNCGMMKTDDVFEAIGTKALAAGYVKDTTIEIEDEDEEAIYVLKNAAEVVIAELHVVHGEDGKSIDVWYFAYRNTYEDVASFAAALAVAEGKAAAAKQQASFNSLVPDVSAAVAAKISGARVSWQAEDAYDGFKTYVITPVFAENAFADNDAWVAFFEEYEASLVSAGFADKYEVPSLGIQGYFNTTSGVLAFLNVSKDTNNNYTGVSVYMMVALEGALNRVLFNVADDSVWTAEGAARYMVASWNLYLSSYYVAKLYAGTATSGYDFDAYFGAWQTGGEADMLETLEYYGLMPCAVTDATAYSSLDSSAYENAKDYYIQYTLNSATEGKIILITLYTEARENGGDTWFYLDAFVSEVDAAPATPTDPD